MDEAQGLIELASDWWTLLLTVLIFSFAPHLLLHLVLLLYPKGNKRPEQILADLFDVPRWKKPFWVAEMALMAIFEAVPLRRAARRQRSRPYMPRAQVLTVLSSDLTVGMRLDGPLPRARATRWSLDPINDDGCWVVAEIRSHRNRRGAEINQVLFQWVDNLKS